jgi:hypothetical protein
MACHSCIRHDIRQGYMPQPGKSRDSDQYCSGNQKKDQLDKKTGLAFLPDSAAAA